MEGAVAVWKFELPVMGRNEVEMPAFSRIIAAEVQHDRPVVYAEVIASQPKVKRVITLVTTGAELATFPGEYVGTLLLQKGYFVVHVYAERAPDEAMRAQGGVR